jgi:hypothetical protein
MRSADGSRVLVYVSSPTTVFLHLDKLERRTRSHLDQPARAKKGRRAPIATATAPARLPGLAPAVLQAPPFWEDAVLLLEGDGLAFQPSSVLHVSTP